MLLSSTLLLTWVFQIAACPELPEMVELVTVRWAWSSFEPAPTMIAPASSTAAVFPEISERAIDVVEDWRIQIAPAWTGEWLSRKTLSVTVMSPALTTAPPPLAPA